MSLQTQLKKLSRHKVLSKKVKIDQPFQNLE